MCISINSLVKLIFIIFFLHSCSTNYIEKENINLKDEGLNNPLKSNVYFSISKGFNDNKPNCIFILPVKSDIKHKKFILTSDTDRFDKIIRKSIYAHLSALNYRDIELSRIDYLIDKYNAKNLNDFLYLAKKIDCDGMLEIKINKFDFKYLGVYSSVNVFVTLHLISSKTEDILWEAGLDELKAKGSVPLSPFSIASGLYSATNNLKEENIYSIADNISRKLLKKLPNPRNLQLLASDLELNISDKINVNNVKAKESITKPLSHKEFQNFITNNQFHKKKFEKLYTDINNKKGLNRESTYIYSNSLFKNGYYEEAIEKISEIELSIESYPDLSFLKGKIYYNMQDYTNAENSFIRAISKNSNSASYFNALGILYIKQNKLSLADASFAKALDIAPNNVKANTIMGVINFNLKKYHEAVYYFTYSAISSYENNDYTNLAKNIILIEKIEKINPKVVNKDIMKKLYKALERRVSKNEKNSSNIH